MAFCKRKDISATVAYLIGVSDAYLKRDFDGLSDLLHTLEQSKEATIIRYLCKLRTELMHNFLFIDSDLRNNLKNIDTISYFNSDEVAKLEKWGVRVKQVNFTAEAYSRLFSELINTHIENCQHLFPEWVNWYYVRDLFALPLSGSSNVLITEYNKFKRERTLYPYAMYIHWSPTECKGMLLDDKLFLKTLYAQHNDTFEDRSCYIDATEGTKNTVYDFIDNGDKVVIAVDCENVDVYKLFGFLKNLDSSSLNKISKLILFDDDNTVDTWGLLSKHTEIPVEHIVVQRVVDMKSLVDVKMTAGICQHHYRDNVDSFIIVASDSDYWGVISSLPTAKFMVVYEKKNISSALLKTFEENKISSCSMDDFYTGNVSKLKEDILRLSADRELSKYTFNCKELLDNIYKEARIFASIEEKNAFYNSYLKKLKLSINKEGLVTIKVG